MVVIDIQHQSVADADAELAVVPANTSLDFEGRAAQALRAVGGPAIDAELATHRRNERGVRVGDVLLTSAGRHPRRRGILWAVIREDLLVAGGDLDDAHVLRVTAPRVWRAVHEHIALHATHTSVAVVPLAAAELGAATSVDMIARAPGDAGAARLAPPRHVPYDARQRHRQHGASAAPRFPSSRCASAGSAAGASAATRLAHSARSAHACRPGAGGLGARCSSCRREEQTTGDRLRGHRDL